jgi:hypothetical protein
MLNQNCISNQSDLSEDELNQNVTYFDFTLKCVKFKCKNNFVLVFEILLFYSFYLAGDSNLSSPRNIKTKSFVLTKKEGKKKPTVLEPLLGIIIIIRL